MIFCLCLFTAESPDGEHVVAPHPGLDHGDPLVVDDRVAVNGEDGRVPVPDPGHRVILHLVHPAGEVGDVALPDADVARGVEGEVGPGVEARQLRADGAQQP